MSSSSVLYTRPECRVTALRQCVSCPPHGPFMRLTALCICNALLENHGVTVTPDEAAAFIQSHYNVAHLGRWPALYCAHIDADNGSVTPMWRLTDQIKES
eukprot:PhM_4_TR1884/c0_g1_i1/m.94066